ncbi:arginine--tRNA ligase [Candidatus Woesearchaeota archaeon]|nr:MAG: arginine--tRNA ligase [Candidatus Woesearchaeota archaeon]
MFVQELKELLKGTLDVDETLIEIPKAEFGDLAYPCFKEAKQRKQSPAQIAQNIAQELKDDIPTHPVFENVEAKGPYLNFFIKPRVIAQKAMQSSFTSEKKDETIVIDYSSPNIAKPFSIAHLRSTAIGNALKHIYKSRGYTVIGVNHLGDWGTQFGKLIAAYELWGDEKQLEKNPLDHLIDIYQKFSEQEKLDPSLTEKGREWFKRLEEGDEQAVQLWELFRELSLAEFKKYYSRLKVEFDSFKGEAFYIDKLDETIQKVKQKVRVEESEGAQVIKLDQFKQPPLILIKSNGTTTYHTRDLAAVFYRLEEYHPKKIIYVTDKRQKLHFEQLFNALSLMGYDKNMFSHVDFGTMTFEGQVMSTREGTFIFLEQVLDLAIEKAKSIIEEKNPQLKNKDKVAEQVGIGAIIFHDLVNDRTKDIDFSWEKALSFDGASAPYVQYTHARISAILRKKSPQPQPDFTVINSKEERKLLRHMLLFNDAIDDACKQEKPHIIAHYLLDLCQLYNTFYAHCQVLCEDETLMNARLHICKKVKEIIQYGLSLLGIEAPEEM